MNEIVTVTCRKS